MVGTVSETETLWVCNYSKPYKSGAKRTSNWHILHSMRATSKGDSFALTQCGYTFERPRIVANPLFKKNEWGGWITDACDNCRTIYDVIPISTEIPRELWIVG